MRTLQEKYTAIAEGNFSKEQFRRDAQMQLPNIVSKFNSFEDTVNILKNKGMIAEAKMQEPKYSTAKPEDAIAPDVLDTGIKFELDKKYGTLDVTDEQYAKCREMAIKNLAKDVLYYVKQDSIQLETPGEKMEKVKLNEEVSEVGNEPVMVDKALITQLLKDFLGEADPRDEAAKAYVASVMRDFKSGDPSRTTQYASWQSMDDLMDDFENYMGDRMDEKYEQPKYSEEELAKISKDQQQHDEEQLRRERGLEEGDTLELSAEDMEKLHKDGKITLPNGSVLHFVGKPANEATQLKETIKKIIAKVITE